MSYSRFPISFSAGKYLRAFAFVMIMDERTKRIKALQALHDALATALTSSEVTVLNLCMSSSHALYLYQVL